MGIQEERKDQKHLSSSTKKNPAMNTEEAESERDRI